MENRYHWVLGPQKESPTRDDWVQTFLRTVGSIAKTWRLLLLAFGCFVIVKNPHHKLSMMLRKTALVLLGTGQISRLIVD